MIRGVGRGAWTQKRNPPDAAAVRRYNRVRILNSGPSPKSHARLFMDAIKTLEGDLQVRELRFAILAARFNDFIVEQLVRGAVDMLKRHGASDKQIEIVRAPGAFELPVVARKLALSKRFDAIIALGAVIKGATAHFDYVAGECAGGLARVANDTGIPVAFGVLTTDTIEQAIERAGTKAGNKGADAAVTALELANLLRKIEQ